jgi:hypothetical protein
LVNSFKIDQNTSPRVEISETINGAQRCMKLANFVLHFNEFWKPKLPDRLKHKKKKNGKKKKPENHRQRGHGAL